MPACACGCGEQTKKGKYLQGHEQKLRKQLDDKVGSLPLLAALVKVTETYALGKMSPEDMAGLVKMIYSK